MGKRGVKPRPVEDRFWEKVNKTDTCWLWTATMNERGYGQLNVRGEGEAKGRPRRAHVLSWSFINGPVPAGMLVLHHCDVRACVRPEHLYLGTPADNMADCVKRGRHVAPWKGRRERVYRLTEADVRAIRSRHGQGESMNALAEEFGVVPSTIRDVVTRHTWAKVA